MKRTNNFGGAGGDEQKLSLCSLMICKQIRTNHAIQFPASVGLQHWLCCSHRGRVLLKMQSLNFHFLFKIIKAP